jgi:hypothetical protein
VALEEVLGRPYGLINTRISNFSVSPTLVAVGEPVRVSGRLEAQFVTTWGVGGETIEILVDGAVVARVTTAGDGSFSHSLVFSTPGTRMVKARYPGSPIYNGCETGDVAVTVVTPEEKKKKEEMAAIAEVLKWLAVAAGVVGGILLGVYVYKELRK